MKRYIGWLFVFVILLLAVVPVCAAEDTLISNGYRYSINSDDTVTILGSSVIYGDVQIPASLEGKTVSAIADRAFEETDSISSVIIPGCVKKVGDEAFANCEALKSVTLEEGIVTLGRRAFGSCPLLKAVHIPLSINNVSSWGYGMNGPFNDTALQSVTFASGRTEIPAHFFEGTKQLRSITLPDTISVIQDNAFQNSGLEEVVFGSGLTEIGDYAFDNCANLVAPVFPEGLTIIRTFAFQDCPKIETPTFPESLRTIDNDAFRNCDGIVQIVLNSGLERLGMRAFSDCDNLTKVRIPASLKYVNTWAHGSIGPFRTSGLTDIIFETGTTQIPQYLFEGTKNLYSVTLPDSIAVIHNNVFQNSSLVEIQFGSGLTEIGDYAFDNCPNLVTPVFPEGLTTIHTFAFQDCPSLTDPTFPNSLRTIDNNAFRNCDNLRRAILNDGLVTLGMRAFSDCDQLFQTYIPASLKYVNTWAHGNIGPFMNTRLRSVLFGEGITAIPVYLFDSCPNLKSIRIPDTITSIGREAFSRCTGLTAVTMPRDLQKVGRAAFNGCTGLTRVAFSPNLNYIDLEAFRGCEKLTALFFTGPGPQMDTRNTFPDCATLYYLEGQEKWSTPYYPDADKYPAVPILGEPDLADRDYFEKLQDHHFIFRDHLDNPVDQVTCSFGSYSLSSGDASTMDCVIAAEEDTEITFTRQGCHPVTLPLELLEGITVIRFYPDTWTEPFVEAAFARDENGLLYDVVYDGITLFAEEKPELTFYVRVNWLNHTPEVIQFSSSVTATGVIRELQEGWNDPLTLQYSLLEQKQFYLLLHTTEDTFIQPIRISVVDLPETLPVDDGETVSLESGKLAELFDHFGDGLDTNLKLNVFDFLPVIYEKEGNNQFSLLFGFKPNCLTRDNKESIRDDFERALLDAQEGTDSIGSLIKNKNKIYEGETLHNPSTRLLIQCEGTFVGIGKGHFNKNGEADLDTICVGMNVDGLISNRKQYLIGTKPVYTEWNFSSENSFLVNLKWLGKDDGWVEPLPSSFDGVSKITGRAGVGIDKLLAAGVKGSINLNYESPYPITWEELSVIANGSVGLDMTILCFEADVVHILGFTNWELKSAATGKIVSNQLCAANPIQWKPQSREYLYAIAPLSVETEGTDSGETLLQAVYPHTMVQFAELPDGRQLAVWVADDGTRSDTNRTTLYYMVQNEEGWSEPCAVDDDGTADFNPVLQVENGTAYLLWQDAEAAIETTDAAEALSMLNLSCARFEEDGFVPMGDIGTDGTYDGTMSLTMLEGQPAVTYTINHNNEILAEERPADLCRVIWNGESWSEPQVLASDLNGVDQTASDGGTIWFTAQDGQNRDLFCFDEEQITNLTQDSEMDANPQIAEGNLIWFREHGLTDGETQIPMNAVTDRYQYLRSGELEALIWVEQDDHQICTLNASFNDGNGWGEPRVLDGGNAFIGSFHGQLLSNGTLQVLVSERDASAEGSPAALRLYTAVCGVDLKLDAVNYVTTTLRENGSMTLNLELSNAGMYTVSAVEVTVLQGTEMISSAVYTMELLPGQTDFFRADVPLGETVPDGLTVTVKPIGFTDADMTDNTAELVLHCTDLSVEEALATSGDTTSVTVMVANRGLRNIDSADVNLTDADGNVLATQTVTGLAVRSAQFVEFTLEQPMEHNTLLFVDAPELGTENLISNNRIPVSVQGKQAGSVTEDLSLSVSDAAVEVTVILSNSTDAATVGSYVCAAYDTDGKMLTCFTKLSHTLLPGRTTCLTETFPKETAKVKLFRLDADFCPVDTALEKEISQ